jgi:lysophospholipase L1-like esterase
MTSKISRLDRNFRAQKIAPGDSYVWVDGADRRLTVRGLPWFDENRPGYARFPARAQKKLREAVWSLAQCPAGGRICFRSNTTRMAVRVTLAEPSGNQPHMPATGQSGISLYAGAGQACRPWSGTKPDIAKLGYEGPLFDSVTPEWRDFTLYLPLYNPLTTLKIGVAPGSSFKPPSPHLLAKPVVFYGTSITQGGCASLPGSDFVATTGRILDVDVVNLGFSGNGQGEPEVAKLMAEVDASLFVLDYAANSTVESLTQTLPGFVQTLRRRHPKTPIALLSIIPYWRTAWSIPALKHHEGLRDALIHFYSDQRRKGDARLHFIDGLALLPLGTSGASVDGGHPSDHGFQVMATNLAPQIERLLYPPPS